MLQGTIMARWDHIHDNDVVTVSPCALSCYEFAPELDDLPGKLTGREQYRLRITLGKASPCLNGNCHCYCLEWQIIQ